MRQFSRAQIYSATGKFDKRNVIGRGGFGSVYKGLIDGRSTPVAIKRLDPHSLQGAPQFWNEIKILSKLRHRNLVTLIGFCDDRGEIALVYEYMPHGNLADHLFENKFSISLSWVQRLKICIGAARGLEYLHNGFSISIVHRDPKCSNILLDEDWEAKISDFGLSKLLPANRTAVTQISGTIGYIAPEYAFRGILTEKSDVYTFGVVLCEVLCGRREMAATDGKQDLVGLTRWFKHCLKEGTLDQIFDARLDREIQRNSLIEFSQITNQCLNDDLSERPTMAEVVAKLEFSLELQVKADSSPSGGELVGIPQTVNIQPSSGSSGVDLEVAGPRLGSPMFKADNTVTEFSSLEGSDFVKEVESSMGTETMSGKDSENYTKQLDKIRFSIRDIKKATNNFDQALVIGRGQFGMVYKGFLDRDMHTVAIKGVVAIKRLQYKLTRGATKLREELEMLPKFRHKNVILLIGYCPRKNEMILVYEYLAFGSLAEHLYNRRTFLSWGQRLKICIGAALGLEYLHTGTTMREGVVHCDVKASHILLDTNWEAKISGFGLSKIVPTKYTHVSTKVTGTLGYLDPYFIVTGQTSSKSDVYSFGVVLFEVLSGRKVTDSRFREVHGSLALWAQHHLETGRINEMVDPRLRGQILPDSLEEFVKVAGRCLHESPTKRPRMAVVLAALKLSLAWQSRTSSSVAKAEVVTRTANATWDEEILDSSPVAKGLVKYSDPDGENQYVDTDLNFDDQYLESSFRTEAATSANIDDMNQEDQAYSIPRKSLSQPSSNLKLAEKVWQFLKGITGRRHGRRKVKFSLMLSDAHDNSRDKMLKSVTSASSSHMSSTREPKHRSGSDSSAPESIPFILDETEQNSETDAESNTKPNRRGKDEELSLPPKNKLSTDLMGLEYTKEVEGLNRRKDILHLISSYPMKPEVEVDFSSLVGKMQSINHNIRKAQSTDLSGDPDGEIRGLIQDVKNQIAEATIDFSEYILEDKIRLGTKSELVPSTSSSTHEKTTKHSEEISFPVTLAILSRAIRSATQRASECIRELTFKKMAISGSNARELASAVKDMSSIKSTFHVVLWVSVSKNQSMGEIKSDIEEQIEEWKERRRGTDEPINFFIQHYNCLLFLICDDDSVDLTNFVFHYPERFRNLQLVLATDSQNAYHMMQVDLEIRVEDHLLPWNLFYDHIGHSIMAENNSDLQCVAEYLVDECHGHLLAIILLARALRGVTDVTVYELALRELRTSEKSSSSSFVEGVSEVMVSVLRFIWRRKRIVSQRCIIDCASHTKGNVYHKSRLIASWINNGLVQTPDEGEETLDDLISSFFLEEMSEDFVKMRDETRVVLLTHFAARVHPLYLEKMQLGLTETPEVEEWDARVVNLSNNQLSELPESPNCPILVNLFLQGNRYLMEIPDTFFDHMPYLQVLDMSNTGIKCLPPSISKLTSLHELSLRNCELLMELPCEIGKLKNLKVFDLIGTELVCLPTGFDMLTKLECLKASFYRHADRYLESGESTAISSKLRFSKLCHLKELSIFVEPEGNWWDTEVKYIIDMLHNLRNLETLKLYLPTVDLLYMLTEIKNQDRGVLYQCLIDFQLIVGRQQCRLVSRLPLHLEERFLKLEKCLNYINGEGWPNVISQALKHARAFYLHRHWTVWSLSALDIHTMDQVKFCLLVECNEMQTVIDESELHKGGDCGCNESGELTVLGSLQYLAIHYMKNLRSIWEGPIHGGSLSCLKTLAVHACAKLTVVFTIGLLGNLTNLECVIVEGCPRINSLVRLESHFPGAVQFLPKLKKISLLDLPELYSIASGVGIAPILESMVVYNCPKLASLSVVEVGSSQIKEIKGETEWWKSLQWSAREWSSEQADALARVFVPLGGDDDLIDDLAKDGNSLQQHLD